jgi:hypothetical protein
MSGKIFAPVAVFLLLAAMVGYFASSYDSNYGEILLQNATRLSKLAVKADVDASRSRSAYQGLVPLILEHRAAKEQTEDLAIALIQMNEDLAARQAGRTVCRRGTGDEMRRICQPRGISELKNSIKHAGDVLRRKQVEVERLAGQLAEAEQKTIDANQAAHASANEVMVVLSRQQWYGRVPSSVKTPGDGAAAMRTTAPRYLSRAKTAMLIADTCSIMGIMATVLAALSLRRRKSQ